MTANSNNVAKSTSTLFGRIRRRAIAFTFGTRFYVIAACIVLIMIALLVTQFTSRGRALVRRMWDIVRKERALYEEKIASLEAISDEETAARGAAAQRALDAMRRAEDEYRRRERELDKREEREIERITRRYEDDPRALANEFADSFGIKFVETSNDDED